MRLENILELLLVGVVGCGRCEAASCVSLCLENILGLLFVWESDRWVLAVGG